MTLVTTPRKSLLQQTTVAVLLLTLASLLVACGSTGPRSLLDDIASGKVILGTKFDQPG